MPNKFYITNPIFYPNADLHLGHAYTTVLADVLARFHRLMDEEVYFLTGSDDNASKVARVAKENGVTPKAFVDRQAVKFKNLFECLNVSTDDFIQTSDQKRHWPGAQKMWRSLVAKGDIYKKSYSGLYCVGCEAFKAERDLIDGKCPDHSTVPEFLEEENYFFKLSEYTNKIKELISSNTLKIVPPTRKNEILALIDRGLEDVSFSRPVKGEAWGIPVPDDQTQTMYVWCDALVNYISALGYGQADDALYQKFWPADLHLVGKDILRFHAAIWPAMLLSAGLPVPKAVLAHGFINYGGRKMSKTVGNVIDPLRLIDEYGADAFRYYLVRELSLFEDSDMTIEHFKDAYNGSLANGLGNLVSRVMKMAETNLDQPVEVNPPADKAAMADYKQALTDFDIKKAADITWGLINDLDKQIQETEPFKLVKTNPEAGKELIAGLVQELYTIARMLNPLLPQTSVAIKELIKSNKSPEAPLFLRKD